MPFNSLLLVSLITDTHYSESGLTVSMTQKAGEKVLFFKMDQDAVRDSLHIDGPICDGLVFYCQNNEKTCCFVELKGNKLDTAVGQVVNTCTRLKYEIKASLGRMGCQPLLKQILWKAYICSHGSFAQGDAKEYNKALIDTFGRDNYYVGGNSDLGPFLRGETNKPTKRSNR